MQGTPRVMTEEEFVQLLSKGKTPKWYSKETKRRIDAQRITTKAQRSDVIYLDFLAKEYFVRELRLIFGRDRPSGPLAIFKGVECAILEDASMKGLVVPSVQDGNSGFVSTERLEKYWSKIFGGEPLPRLPKRKSRRK